MLAVHTTTADLYSRLWCVYEVFRARSMAGLTVKATMSDAYLEQTLARVRMFESQGFSAQECFEAADVQVHTIRARCACLDDEAMLVTKISKEGGFAALDDI